MTNGVYSLLYIDIGDGFKPISCITDTNFTESVEMLETTTRDNLGWKTSVPTNQNYGLDFSGLSINTIYGGDSSKYSYDILKLIKRNKTLFDWKIENSVNGDIDSGKGYLLELSGAFVIDDFISFSANIEGYGEPTSSNITPVDVGLESLLEILL